MTQLSQVKSYILEHGSITTWDAIQKFRCTRLSEYIRLLREEGFVIKDDWQHNETRRWVKYVLIGIPLIYQVVLK